MTRNLAASTALAIALLGASVPAFAWRHTELVWMPDDFPLNYWVADDGTEPNTEERCEASDGLEGCCEDTVPAGYCRQAAAEGFEAWHAAQCAEFDVADQGVCKNIGSAPDHRYQITFNDPAGQNDDTALAVTFSIGGDNVFSLDGVQYKHFESTDIVFSKNQTFATHEQVLSNDCDNATNMRGVMTHEIGHSLGMGHSCDDPLMDVSEGGGPCPDPVLRDATMFWQEGPCRPDAADINEDDIEGFNALYGPFATFACSHQITEDLSVGVVPFDLHCVIVSDYLAEVTSADWVFGDGGTASALTATHTYTEPGNYTIQLTVHGEREACGEDGWENNYRRIGYVRACGEPTAAFEVSHVDGLKYKMLNDSDVSVYGCVSNIEWEVYAGGKVSGEPVISGLTAWEPLIEFPDEGEYTVVMNLGGIGGTGAAMATVDVRNYRGVGYGCSTTGLAGGSLGVLFAVALIARRRR